jgi:two-component system sensor histidine kinase/response regulator FitF
MKSMLIIDGSEIIATLFAEIFQRRGWNVAACEDGDCAMDRLVGNERYDVVILGYRVPGTDGLRLVRFIRALEHRKTTAVVMVTGSAEVTDEALAAGVDEVLLKPINPNALVCAVDKLVS